MVDKLINIQTGELVLRSAGRIGALNTIIDFISKEAVQKFSGTLFFLLYPVWLSCSFRDELKWKALATNSLKKKKTTLIFDTLNNNVHLQKIFLPTTVLIILEILIVNYLFENPRNDLLVRVELSYELVFQNLSGF